jgi:hypothetical protein
MRLIDAEKLPVQSGCVFLNGFPMECGGTYNYIRYVTEEDIKNAKRYDHTPKGKWVQAQEQPFFRKHFHTVVCSECNREGRSSWAHCPHCGSKNEVDK